MTRHNKKATSIDSQRGEGAAERESMFVPGYGRLQMIWIQEEENDKRTKKRCICYRCTKR